MSKYLSDLDYWAIPLIYVFSCFILFVAGKFIYQLFHRSINVDHEMVEQDNFAFAVSNLGYYIALLLAVCGSMMGDGTHELGHDLLVMGGFGLGAILLLNISILINDKVLFSRFDLRKSICASQNTAVGIMEGANCIANGLIIFGVLTVEADHILIALAYWAIAQVLLLILMFAQTKMVPYNLFEQLEKGNTAVAVSAAGFLIGLANIIRYAIETEHESWGDSLTAIGIQLVVALLIFPVLRFLTDKLLLPGRSITDELVNQEKANTGVALIEAFAYISGSILITLSF